MCGILFTAGYSYSISERILMNLKNNDNFKNYFTAVLSCLAAVFADQLTKWLAVTYLKGKDAFVLIPGVLEFQYLENRGAAFGIFRDRQIFFIIGAIVVFIFVCYYYGKIPSAPRYLPLKVSAVLVTAGAAGNLIDRVTLNYVVDFIYFSLIYFPIFNIADCYVVVACFLFAFLIFFYYKEEDLACFSFAKNKDNRNEKCDGRKG